jgi:hypothetical protein
LETGIQEEENRSAWEGVLVMEGTRLETSEVLQMPGDHQECEDLILEEVL